MTIFYDLINWLLLFSYWLLIAGITLRIMMKRRTVASAMAWLLVIYILPLVGIITYVLFGELHMGKKRAERAKELWPVVKQWLKELNKCKEFSTSQNSELAQPLFQLCERHNNIAGVKAQKMQIFTTADSTLTSIIRDINQSQRNIEIVFYIWQVGGLADQVADALMDASRRGVHCRVMLDSAGSFHFFRSAYPKMMREAGIEIVEALKVNLFRVFLHRMDLRQHRKIVLIDNHIAYVGSLNMVDPRYFKQNAGVGQWIDLMTRLEGSITSLLGIVYAGDWEMETGQRLLPLLPECRTVEETTDQVEKGHALQFIASGPGSPEEMLHQSLLTTVYSARKELTMTTPYFVPSDDLLHAICTAALRGVNVSIILPKKNDSFIVGWASRAFFSELLRAGVKIYQFRRGLLHTKSILVDGQLSLIGSVNLDIRSLWLNFEITVAVDDSGFGQKLASVHKKYLSQSTQLSLRAWSKRPMWQRIVERLFYFFSPVL